MKILHAIPGVRPAMVTGKKKIRFYYVDHTLMCGHDVVAVLAEQEAALLGLLVKAKGRAISRDQMKSELWLHGDDVKFPDDHIRQLILRLRRCLEPHGYKIESLYKHGYRMWPVIETDWSNPL